MPDISSLTDEELVNIVRTKDQEAYADIVRRYESRLFRYAMSFVHDEAKAKDILQNAFIKAFINLRGFNTKKKFSSWIYRIVHNETINELKKHKREVPLEVALSLDKDDGKEHPDVTLDKEQEAQQLQEMLDDIPITYRSPLVLFFFEEKSYEEISDILRMPIGTVGTRINRGKKLLRTLYEQKHRR